MIDYKELGFDENLITLDDLKKRFQPADEFSSYLDDYAIRTSVIGQKSIIPDRLADGITQVPARYVFYISGGVIHVRNGATGKIDYSGTVASTVIQDVLTYMFDNTLYGRLFFTAGTYNMAKQIAIPDKVWIDGEGEGTLFFVPNSTVFAQPAVGDPGLISTTTAENAENYGLFRNWDYAGETQLGNVGIKITNIQIDMNKANNSKPAWANAYYGIGIAFNWLKRPKIKNVYIKNCFAEGIAIWGPANQYIGPTSWPNVNGHVKDSTFEACGDGTDSIMAGILVDYHAKNVVISGNVFDSCYNGVSLEDHCQENTVENNVFKDCTGYNIHLASDDGYNVINGNKIYDPGIAGIYGSNVGNNCVITNNVVVSSSQYGIYFEGSGHTIEDNTCVDCDASGIMASAFSEGSINNNKCRNNGKDSGETHRDGITIKGASNNNQVTGNSCNDNQGTKTQQYGIAEKTDTNTPDYNSIKNNFLRQNAVLGLIRTGLNTATSDNYGSSGLSASDLTDVQKTTLLSATFAIDSTGIKTVTTAHGLIHGGVAPAVGDFQISVVKDSATDDWGFNLLKVESADTANVVCKINVSTASVSGGATAKLAIRYVGRKDCT